MRFNRDRITLRNRVCGSLLLWLGLAGPALAGVDLQVNTVSLSPISANVGEPVTLTVVVSNSGDTQSELTKVMFHLSSDASYSPDDPYLVHVSIPPVAAGASTQIDHQINAPSVNSGNYYIIARADPDAEVNETDETNNSGVSPAIAITKSVDLAVTDVTVSSTTILLGETFDVLITLTNNGTSPTNKYTRTLLLLSTDTDRSDTDRFLGMIAHDPLQPGQSESRQVSVVMPADFHVGTVYVLAVADEAGVEQETDETNNITASAAVTAEQKLDLIPVTILPEKTDTEIGHGLTYTAIVKNIGQSTSRDWFHNWIYLSADDVITTSDIPVAYFNSPPLKAGENFTYTGELTVPVYISEGNYYLGLIVDNDSTETEIDETNNALSTTLLNIKHIVDLAPTSFALGKTVVNPGDMFSVTMTVINQGSSTTNKRVPAWFTLSTDRVESEDDKWLADQKTDQLYSNMVFTHSTSVTIRADQSPGMYYLFGIADHDNVLAETKEDNNSIWKPLAVAYYVDLQPTALSIDNTAPEIAQSPEIGLTVINNGQHATTEPTKAGVYLSTDNQISGTDSLIGNLTVPILQSGETLTLDPVSLTIPNIVPGTYYLGVVTDHDNIQAETNETNNTYVFGQVTVYAQGASTDQDGDGIPDSQDPDRDGDGVDNNLDSYPDDATRSQIAAVSGFTAAQQGQTVNINWNISSELEIVTGYRIYRQQYQQQDTLLATVANNISSYTDQSVQNGTGYAYRIVPMDANGNEGETAPAIDVFVSFNAIPVTNFQAVLQGADAVLTWESTGIEFLIYRDTSADTQTVFATATGLTYTDSNIAANTGFYYRVAAIVRYTNPFTREEVLVSGPVSDAVFVESIPDMLLTIDNATVAADGAYEILATSDPMTVTGSVVNTVAPLNTAATSGTTTVNASTTNGELRLILPVTGADWAISVVEQTAQNRTVTATIRLVQDSVAPVIQINSESNITVESDMVTLSGTITDNNQVAEAYLTNSRTADQQYGIVLAAGGNFSAQVALQRGENLINIYGVDAAGNIANTTLTVTRALPQTPEIAIASPRSGSVVYTDTVTVQGTVYTSLPAEQLRFNLGTLDIFPSSTMADGSYSFTFNNVRLVEGYNSLAVRVYSTAGIITAPLVITYSTQPPTQSEEQAPQINITSPTLSTVASGDSITVTGNISGNSAVTATINGQPVTLTGPDQSGGSFSYPINLTSCVNGVAQLVIVVVDAAGNTSTQTLTIICDQNAPVVNVTTPALSLPPVVNTVTDVPFEIRGTVTDENLGGLSINGRAITVVPTATVGTYEFSAALGLSEGSGQTILLEAWDQGGNRTSQNYIVDVNIPVAVEIITPRNGSNIAASVSGTQINIVARLTGLEAGQSVTAAVNDGTPAPMTLDANAATAVILTTLTDGSHQLVLRVVNADGSVATTARSNFTLVAADTSRLRVSRSDPLNNQAKVAPNQAITVYFSTTIDPALLQINVRETVHGLNYDLGNQQGTDLSNIPDPTLVEVHRDMEPLTGALTYYPTNRYVTFFPERRYAYNADIFVDVVYDGTELERFSFKIKPLPTLIGGVVTDQAGVPIADLPISIPELNLTTVSDEKGNYILRSDKSEVSVSTGRYPVVFNPGMKVASFGTIEDYVAVDAERINSVRTVKVPRINTAIPYVTVNSRQTQVLLSRGNLQLNLANADLSFPNGRSSGNIHVQFMPAAELPFGATDVAVPYWMYAIQPSGVSVRGNVGVSIEMPELYGSRAYIPAEGTYVVMLGFNTLTKAIEPVGVGRISGTRVESVGNVALQSLDYIGYSLLDPEAQEILERYANGEIPNLTLLRSELEQLVSP